MLLGKKLLATSRQYDRTSDKLLNNAFLKEVYRRMRQEHREINLLIVRISG